MGQNRDNFHTPGTKPLLLQLNIRRDLLNLLNQNALRGVHGYFYQVPQKYVVVLAK
jgi:hypothetical protein